MTRSTNARLAGFGYLSYIVVGILNEVLMYRATSAEGTAAKLARIAEYSTDVRLAMILKLAECFSVFVLAVAPGWMARTLRQRMRWADFCWRLALPSVRFSSR